MGPMSFYVLVIAALLISVQSVIASPDNRQYEEGEYIPVFANIVRSPKHDCATLLYFELPFCPPGNEIKNRKKSIQEVVEGDCFTNTQYDIRFKEERDKELLCGKYLRKSEVAMLRKAVKDDTEFQMSFNNILLWGIVGKVNHTSNSRPKYFLVKHLTFFAFYIKNGVREAFLVPNFHSAVDITKDVGIRVNFTYSVIWKNYAGYEKQRLLELATNGNVHSRLLLCVLVFVWVGLLFLATKLYLTNYINRNLATLDERTKRWQVLRPLYGEATRRLVRRQIHGDYCNCPEYSSLLGAILGIGTQLLILICVLFIMFHAGVLHSCMKETLFDYICLIYSLTSVASGYIATLFLGYYTDDGWIECVFQTGILYLGPTILTFVWVDMIADFTPNFSIPRLSESLVIPYMKLALLMALLLSTGGKMGDLFRPFPRPPCPTRRVPRVANPRLPWYLEIPVQIFLGGLLPFITVLWDMDSIYASLWLQKLCGAFDIMFTGFIRVLIVTIVVNVGFTYIQLSKRDHHPWWRSVFRGGSTAIFMYTYGLYYFVKSDSSKNTILIFIGYNFIVFYALFMVLGTIGFCASYVVFRCMFHGALKHE